MIKPVCYECTHSKGPKACGEESEDYFKNGNYTTYISHPLQEVVSLSVNKLLVITHVKSTTNKFIMIAKVISPARRLESSNLNIDDFMLCVLSELDKVFF